MNDTFLNGNKTLAIARMQSSMIQAVCFFFSEFKNSLTLIPIDEGKQTLHVFDNSRVRTTSI